MQPLDSLGVVDRKARAAHGAAWPAEADGAELELLAMSTDGELQRYPAHHEQLVADVRGDVTL